MIAVFGIITGICFAWGCIATATAVYATKATEVWEDAAKSWRQNYEEERDRAAANSLSEYRAWHPVAMMPGEPETQREYSYDPTGLVRDEVDPRDVQ